jgi:anthranilate synthase/aminodeoxychorismate synthase-like glutamine amidotransferase
MSKVPLAFLDNRDSFTWNLVQGLRSLGETIRVLESGRVNLADFEALSPNRILIGPGPGHPRDAELSLALFEAFPRTPILGVCLGHQALAVAAGGTIGRTPELAHGRPIEVHHHAEGLFQGLPTPVPMGRYHSLTVLEEGLPEELEITARSPIGEVLSIAHKSRPHFGVQFHPESILSEHGQLLLANFLRQK